MTSIVIPAHNEAASIEDCLRSLLADANEDEFEVIVACNGCTDDTAEISRSFCAEHHSDQNVIVLDIDEPSKITALNAGITTAVGPSVIFLDADVALSTEAARALVRALERPGILAASTAIDLKMTDASLISRSYHRFWERLPSIANGLAGRGVYALSPAGLKRLGQFPKVIADDRLIDLMFTTSERALVETTSTVTAARTARALISRKSRVFAGNNELDAIDAAPPQSGGWRSVVRSKPSTVFDLPAYLGINAIAKIQARRNLRRGSVGWNHDVDTRST